MYNRVKIKVKRGIYVISSEGIIVFALKLKGFLIRKIKRNNIADIAITVSEPVNEALSAPDESIAVTEPIHVPSLSEIEQQLFVDISPIPTISTNEKVVRINIVIDTLNKNFLYGGVATSIIFSIVLANRLNCPLRIITRHSVTDPKAFFEIAKLHRLAIPSSYEFYSFPYNNQRNDVNMLPISEKDIFISTSWWSSYVVREINMRKKYLYIIQEYEKIFYPNGDHHVMADSIFSDKAMLPIVNTKVLYDFYGSNNYKHIYDNGLYFEPAFPHISRPSKKDFNKKKEKLNLFFYDRPQMPRNLSFTGLKLLDAAIERGIIKTEDWDIFFAGQNVTSIKFCNGYIPKNHGKLDWDNYSSFIANIDLCVALMLAPCPSYIPLDLASSGATVLTNTYKNKTDLDYYSKNIICSDINLENMLEKLQMAINLAQDTEQRYSNFINNNIYKDWDDAFSCTVNKLAEMIHENEI